MKNTQSTPTHSPTETVSDEKKVVCSKCGKDEFIGNWNKTTQEELKSRKFCFECNYWYELFLRKDGKDVIRLDGIHRSLGEDKPTTPDRFKGSCGSKFVVEFMDGRVVTTTDLWYQGKIPDAWKAELPDNAISLKGTK